MSGKEKSLVFILAFTLIFPVICQILCQIFIWSRLKYLKVRQKSVHFDFGTEITLRYATWAYFPSIFIIAGGVLGYARVWHNIFLTWQTVILAIIFLFMVVVLPVLAGASVIVPRLRSRVVLIIGKQISYFKDTRHLTIQANEIEKYYCDAVYYRITQKDGYIHKVPASLKHSEILMNFLENATSHKKH